MEEVAQEVSEEAEQLGIYIEEMLAYRYFIYKACADRDIENRRFYQSLIDFNIKLVSNLG